MYTYLSLSLYIYIYICIYISLSLYLSLSLSLYIYILFRRGGRCAGGPADLPHLRRHVRPTCTLAFREPNSSINYLHLHEHSLDTLILKLF